ncbi:uncharacterized protein [Lolium perenne]|uniref:uncharacterized protein n=1 Tax=Lolium perenne TaxID=4522 RepID=UPI0021EA9BF5|nr:N6-adenosine-methyltransferase non-catalytic subunit MTB [Lolium perenne]
MDGSKGNAEEDAYHVTGDLRSPKIPRISPDGSKDREFDRRGREDKSDWDSSRSETSADRADARGRRSGSTENINERRGSAVQENIGEDRSSVDDEALRKVAILPDEAGQHDLRMVGVENKETPPKFGNDGWDSSGDRSNREAQPSQIPDNERSTGTKDKTKVDAHRDTSDRGRDSSWNVKTRDAEGSEQYPRNRQWRDPTEANPLEWRSPQERLDGTSSHGRAMYRQDSRGRSESGRGFSSYGRYDRSDSIEIRPNSNFDFGQEGSASARKSDVGAHRELIPGATDDKGSNHPEADQSGSTTTISSLPQQGPKGDRSSRGGRGRPNGRDSQRIGVPVPLMPPPTFGAHTLPPGQMQHMGPNIPHSPGPLMQGVFMPPFPGPMVWPGAGGVDLSMLSVPPNLPIPPPDHRFTPSMGGGPGHNVHLNQMGAPTNVLGLGFNQMNTPSREMPHDRVSGGWVPHRNSGPNRKAPSRGEQNDYSQNFVDTGMRPQNFIRELDLTSVAEDYPKLRELIQRKDEIVANAASPPMYYKCDLREHVLSPDFFGTKFDVILVDPPWEEYVHRAPGITDHIEHWNVEDIMNLKIEAIADTPSFLFLWVGDGVGLEQGRQCLKKWGFRRCEDVCWVKTNKKNASSGLRHDSRTLLQHSKEHCLMGIKGTVRRSTDGHVIHANIDTDIIIAEEPTDGSTKKPDDMYRIIEHFALGKRRLELFGEDHNIRPGWLTLGKDLSYSNFNKEAYNRSFADNDGKVWLGGGGRNPPPGAPHLIVTTPEIEGLRPKSPPPKN